MDAVISPKNLMEMHFLFPFLFLFIFSLSILYRVRIDDSGNLVIESASKLDQGRYQCSAKNLAVTRDSRPVRLRVHGKFFLYLIRPRCFHLLKYK